MIENSESELTEAFAELVQYSKSLIDPVIKVLVKMLESKTPEERDEQRKQMLDTLYNRERILGNVIGKMTIDKFWREFLKSNWGKKEKNTPESEQLQEMA